MKDVTHILAAIEQGDPKGGRALLPLVYDELRELAAVRLAREKPGQTLEATALVHEAYLRLVDVEASPALEESGPLLRRRRRGHAAHSRRTSPPQGGIQHGGGLRRVDLLDADAVAPTEDEQVLLLDEALTRLAAARPQAAELVKLRFFAGLTLEEIAPLLALSPRSTRRLWVFARAWLRRDMERPMSPRPEVRGSGRIFLRILAAFSAGRRTRHEAQAKSPFA